MGKQSAKNGLLKASNEVNIGGKLGNHPKLGGTIRKEPLVSEEKGTEQKR